MILAFYPFDPKKEFPPIPFEERHLRLALRLKEGGLEWQPYGGCFLWDPDECIPVHSPLPARVYFILNLGHFVRLLGGPEEIARRLVWLPTWHQARRIAENLGVGEKEVLALFAGTDFSKPGDDLLGIYHLILKRLGQSRF